jgi:hypothetical protein
MAIRQTNSPNLGVTAMRGWCLKFVDDAVSAPNTNRQPSAQAAYNVENGNGNTRTSELPVGVWVPIFFSLDSGQYRGLGHAAWAYNFGNRIEIHDSETRTGARAVYTSINQVIAWFGNHSPRYLGWSYWIDGIQAVEDYTPPVTPGEVRVDKSGTATVPVDVLNVRNEPSTDAAIVAQYSHGQSFNYDSYIIANGFVWLSYVSFGGVRRYIAEGPYDGNPNNVYVSGGVG